MGLVQSCPSGVDFVTSAIPSALRANFAVYTLPDDEQHLDKTASLHPCCYCNLRESKHVILPCKHRCLCNQCARALPGDGVWQCPKCKQKIVSIV